MTDSAEILQLVNHHFPQFSEPALKAEIAKYGQVSHYQSGDIIMDYGSYVKQVPLVIKGSIKVMREGDDSSELLLYFLNAGDTCSVSFTCCMMEKRSSIRTIAEDDTSIIGIPIKYIDQWMNTYRSWRNFVMMSYDNRIMELVKTLDSIAFDKLDQRLLAYLNKKAMAHQASIIEATHQEIAYDLNVSREAVSRLLKQLEKTGKVRLGRNLIEVF